MAKVNQTNLLNLAIVRIKEEQDFIENTIMKFVEVLNDLEKIDEELYLKIKYGSTDKDEIVLIKNGLSLSLSKILIESYKDYVTVDRDSDTFLLSPTIINAMEYNMENSINIYEAQMNLFL